MKNKKLQYLLLSLTILIWGFILYKVFFRKEDEIVGNMKINSTHVINSEQETKPVALLLNYTDPFLKTNDRPSDKNRAKITNQTPISNQISWPRIEYTGMVQNKITNKVRANIAINGTNYIMQEDEEIAEITLVKIHADSIILSKNKIKKSILKSI